MDSNSPTDSSPTDSSPDSPQDPRAQHPTEAKKSFFANYSASWWIPVAVLIALIKLKGSLACGAGLEAPPALAPLSDSEALSFGAKIERALEECSPESIDQIFDMQYILSEAVRKSGLPKRAQKQVLAQIQERMQTQDIGLCDPDDDYEKARFLRIRERDGRSVLLVRIWGAEGFDYLEFFAGKDKEGRIIANDAYVYGAGSTMLGAIEEVVTALMESEVSTAKGRELQSAMNSIDADPEHAMQVIDELPRAVRETRALQTQALSAASTVSIEVYAEQLERYKKIFPNDSSTAFVSLFVYTSNTETEMALKTLDEIEEIIGGDDYLYQLRGDILIADENYPAALTMAKKGVEAEPEDVMAYYTLFQAHVWNRDFPGAVEVLDLLAEKFDDAYSEEEMIDMGDAFLEFMESAEWQGFLSASVPASDLPASDDIDY